MFSGCLQDFSRMFIGCSDGSCGPGGIWWSQLFYDPSYSMIPAIRWSPAIWWFPAIQWSPAIWWSIGSKNFDSPKVYGDTSITDGLVWFSNSAPQTAADVGDNCIPTNALLVLLQTSWMIYLNFLPPWFQSLSQYCRDFLGSNVNVSSGRRLRVEIEGRGEEVRRQVEDLAAAHHLQPTNNSCRLCLSEKYTIMFQPEMATLNQRDEFYNACMHKQNKLLDMTWFCNFQFSMELEMTCTVDIEIKVCYPAQCMDNL